MSCARRASRTRTPSRSLRRDDNLNITISQVAREFFHLQNVVARIGDPARESVFTAFGLRTVCPTKMAADSVYQALLSPWEPRRLTFGTATVSFRTWQAVGPAVGMPVGEAPHFPGERVFGVVPRRRRHGAL